MSNLAIMSEAALRPRCLHEWVVRSVRQPIPHYDSVEVCRACDRPCYPRIHPDGDRPAMPTEFYMLA